MTELINLLDETAEQFGVVKTRGNVIVYVTQDETEPYIIYRIAYNMETYELVLKAFDEVVTTNLTPEIVETLIKELA